MGDPQKDDKTQSGVISGWVHGPSGLVRAVRGGAAAAVGSVANQSSAAAAAAAANANTRRVVLQMLESYPPSLVSASTPANKPGSLTAQFAKMDIEDNEDPVAASYSSSSSSAAAAAAASAAAAAASSPPAAAAAASSPPAAVEALDADLKADQTWRSARVAEVLQLAGKTESMPWELFADSFPTTCFGGNSNSRLFRLGAWFLYDLENNGENPAREHYRLFQASALKDAGLKACVSAIGQHAADHSAFYVVHFLSRSWPGPGKWDTPSAKALSYGLAGHLTRIVETYIGRGNFTTFVTSIDAAASLLADLCCAVPKREDALPYGRGVDSFVAVLAYASVWIRADLPSDGPSRARLLCTIDDCLEAVLHMLPYRPLPLPPLHIRALCGIASSASRLKLRGWSCMHEIHKLLREASRKMVDAAEKAVNVQQLYALKRALARGSQSGEDAKAPSSSSSSSSKPQRPHRQRAAPATYTGTKLRESVKLDGATNDDDYTAVVMTRSMRSVRTAFSAVPQGARVSVFGVFQPGGWRFGRDLIRAEGFSVHQPTDAKSKADAKAPASSSSSASSSAAAAVAAGSSDEQVPASGAPAAKNGRGRCCAATHTPVWWPFSIPRTGSEMAWISAVEISQTEQSDHVWPVIRDAEKLQRALKDKMKVALVVGRRSGAATFSAHFAADWLLEHPNAVVWFVVSTMREWEESKEGVFAHLMGKAVLWRFSESPDAAKSRIQAAFGKRFRRLENDVLWGFGGFARTDLVVFVESLGRCGLVVPLLVCAKQVYALAVVADPSAVDNNKTCDVAALASAGESSSSPSSVTGVCLSIEPDGKRTVATLTTAPVVKK